MIEDENLTRPRLPQVTPQGDKGRACMAGTQIYQGDL